MNTWKADIVTGTSSIILAGFVLLQSMRFPLPRGGDFGPALFPRVIAAMLAVFGAVVLIQAIRLRTRPAVKCESDHLYEEITASFHGLRNVAITIVAMIVYMVVVSAVGFMLTTLVMLFVLMKAYGVSILRSALFSCLITAFVYVLFAILLHVVLP